MWTFERYFTSCYAAWNNKTYVTTHKIVPKINTNVPSQSGEFHCTSASHYMCPRSGELRMQKLKPHLVRTQSLKVLPLKPGVGQYIAVHATLTARDFFLAYFYPSGPFTCIFFQNLSWFFPVLAVANTGSCVGPQNKTGHPAGCKFPCWVPTKYQ